MKNKRIILLFLVMMQSPIIFGQRIEFSYDESGNRLGRVLVTERLKSASIQFPVSDPKNLKIAEENRQMNDIDGELNILVYPNPNVGIIKISISNLPNSSNSILTLYNLTGSELITRKNFGSYSEMDISRLKDGIYILRIKINESIFDWKVVKSH